MMKNKSVLVTGGCGYIGSHTMLDLLTNGYQVICVDDLRNARKDVIPKIEALTKKKIVHYKVDVCHPAKMEAIFKKHSDISSIIHFAADKYVNESTREPLKYYKNNISGITNLLGCAEKFDAPYFVFSSSCSVYGNPDKLPVTESAPYAKAESPYALTKQIGEMILGDYAKYKPLSVALLRYFNPAGAHPSLAIGENTPHPQSLVPLIIKAGLEKKPVYIFGDDYDTRDGSCIRDFIHVCDLARAHRLALEYLFENQEKSSKGKKSSESCVVFNLGTGKGTTIKEAIAAFERTTKVTLDKQIAPRRKGDVIAIYADYAKARKKLGWKAEYDIKDIMKTAWEYALKNK